jgi:hypothetical protein
MVLFLPVAGIVEPSWSFELVSKMSTTYHVLNLRTLESVHVGKMTGGEHGYSEFGGHLDEEIGRWITSDEVRVAVVDFLISSVLDPVTLVSERQLQLIDLHYDEWYEKAQYDLSDFAGLKIEPTEFRKREEERHQRGQAARLLEIIRILQRLPENRDSE